MGYENDPQYASFKQLLEAPVQDAVALLADRFPIPRCASHSSHTAAIYEVFLSFS